MSSRDENYIIIRIKYYIRQSECKTHGRWEVLIRDSIKSFPSAPLLIAARREESGTLENSAWLAICTTSSCIPDKRPAAPGCLSYRALCNPEFFLLVPIGCDVVPTRLPLLESLESFFPLKIRASQHQWHCARHGARHFFVIIRCPNPGHCSTLQMN